MINENVENSCAGPHWKRIGVKQHHGICVPLFSLLGHHSAGIGEFLDLIPLIHWCQEVGCDVIQLLPINDLGQGTSPYSAISAYALNPIHLTLKALLDSHSNAELLAEYQKIRALGQVGVRVDYPPLYAARDLFLKKYIEAFGQTIAKDNGYRQFQKSQADWLPSYALFKSLKERRGWSSWTRWPEKGPPPSEVLDNELKRSIEHHSMIQYFCFEQMKRVKKEAEQHHVWIKGDIPILLDKESADVWQHQELFQFDLTAGAPPDMYKAEGQNWQAPLFRWEIAEKNNYHWWRRRLEVASSCFDLFRLDHVVGFFRIWAIPIGASARDGRFVPGDPATWIAHGDQLLRMMIQSSSMLPLAEDLGVIPDGVRDCLHRLGICGTKVMRWERAWNSPGQPYIPYDCYDPISMTTVSTHDSTTVQQWWNEDPGSAQAFCHYKNWHYQTDLSLDQHHKILYDSHHTQSLFHINLLQEYMVQLPDIKMGTFEDQRINIPGLVAPRNWSFRFPLSVDDIVNHQGLKNLIRSLLLICFVLTLFRDDSCEAAGSHQNERHITTLYSGLDPLSVSEHLALYTLYPFSEPGQRALKEAALLLTGANDALSVELLEFISQTPRVIEQIVDLVNQSPHKESSSLSLEQCERLSKLGDSLGNRKLKGFHATTEAEVLALPDCEIDLARGLLLSELGGGDWLKIRTYELQLDLMALQIRARLNGSNDPQTKIDCINRFLFEEMHFRFPPHSLYAKDVDVYTFLPAVLDSRRGVCLGVSVIYLCLAQRLGLELEMITPPGHIYVRWRVKGVPEINIETTARGIHLDSDHYLGVNTRSLQERTIREVIGLTHMNRASVFLTQGDFTAAKHSYLKARPYLPHDLQVTELLAYTHLLTDEREKGLSMLKGVVDLLYDHEVAHDTMSKDLVEGLVDPEGLKPIFMHVDEERQSILEKQKQLLEVVKKYPQFKQGWFSLAVGWLQLHRQKEALEVLEHYHTLYAADPTAAYYLAILNAERMDYRRAWDFFLHAKQLVEAREYNPKALKELRKELIKVSPLKT